ncbi:MAG: S41 family peptidase [Pirellulaceae bacterium]
MTFPFRPAFLLLILTLTAQPVLAQTPKASEPEAPRQVVEYGITLEQNREWIKAIQHYEAVVREYPEDQTLRRRLLISRLHYDVIRRLTDQSLADISTSEPVSNALNLYSEVLARLEMSYVDPIDLTEVIRGGTAYLEVALTEPGFLNEHLPNVDRRQVEDFRTAIHKVTLSRPILNRYDARAVVTEAAERAERSIGMDATTTVVQFTLGAIGLLDPYSSFLSSEELTEVESQIEGNFVGLGIALEPHEVPLHILNVIPGGPAEEMGIVAGDRIVQIGNITCQDVGADRAADLLRGPPNSNLRLLIASEEYGQRDLVISRRRVEVPSIEDVQILKPETGLAYLKISSFQKTTVSEIDRALWDLHQSGMKSLIIDVRGNPGGWLDASIAVADRFLPKGRIVSTRGKNGIENQNYDATLSGTWDMPLTLLIDKDSASASEILAGAIRDNRRGEIIGETTYGKGSVQGLFHTKLLSSGIRLTVSKFYSPNGQAISERGVKPTFAIDPDSQPRYVAKVPTSGRSSQKLEEDYVLQVAIERSSKRNVAAQRGFPRN